MILESIDKEIDAKFGKDYVLNNDYRLSFYSNNDLDDAHKYIDINDAINNGLLANSQTSNFKNFLFVKIEGIS